MSRSGVYCSVSIALEQCMREGVVDVFQVTKTVRRSKPGAVTTQVCDRSRLLFMIHFWLQDQYNSIYDVIDLYIQSKNT